MCVGTDLASSAARSSSPRRTTTSRPPSGCTPTTPPKLAAEWDELVALASNPAVVAIGETGFDLYYHHSPVADQEAAFRAPDRSSRDSSASRS